MWPGGSRRSRQQVRKPHGACDYEPFTDPPQSWSPPPRPVSLRRMIRQRRSAVAMDGETRLARDDFYRMLDRTLAVPGSGAVQRAALEVAAAPGAHGAPGG